MYIITTSCPNCFEDTTVTSPDTPRYESTRKTKLCGNCGKAIIVVEVFPNNAIFVIYTDLRNKDNGREHRAERWVPLVENKPAKEADNLPSRFKRYRKAFNNKAWLAFQTDPDYYLQVDRWIDIEQDYEEEEEEEKQAVLV